MKLRIILLFMMILTGLLLGCTSNKVEYLDPVDFEMDVCREDCSDNETVVMGYLESYRIKIDALNGNIQNIPVEELNVLRNDEIYDREDIPRDDLQDSNYDIPVFYPYMRLSYFLSSVVVHIKNSNYESTVYGTNFSNLMYLFNDNQGFYSHTVSEGSESERRYRFSFRFVEEGLEYLVTQYNVSDDRYDYVISFKDGVYREYSYDSDDSYTFVFIDILGFRYLRSGYLNGDEFFIYHDPDHGIRYELLKTGLRKISFYDGLEYICSLNDKADDYLLTINGHFLNDWDELHLRPEDITPYSLLFSQNIRVYEDYLVLVRGQGLRYYSIDMRKNLTESEATKYIFPETFSKDISFSEVLQKFNYFVNIESNLDMLNLKETDLLEHIKTTLMLNEEE
jgi:hypothetical protein